MHLQTAFFPRSFSLQGRRALRLCASGYIDKDRDLPGLGGNVIAPLKLFPKYHCHFRHVCILAERQLWQLSLSVVCPSVRMKQLENHWTNSHEFCYRVASQFQLLLKWNSFNVHFTWSPAYISARNVCLWERIMLRTKIKKCKVTRCVSCILSPYFLWFLR